MRWTYCGSDLVKKNGDTRQKKQSFCCLECGKQWSENNEAKILGFIDRVDPNCE
ncbi:hypothetical protein DB44_AP00160 [Candidatus Protochlamydia amoebophila]|uniref:Uncharacterized protein n=1 Tax=Candidatus Protochlamydia amoebophila TaxID=362787 RepID=A0A0C1K4B3_9BACT|nr:hypothetical protein DB44_AP00160 [Candidatus Protochlamydia amoebophila]